MRIERWYWLIAFCALSFAIHLGLAYKTSPLYRLTTTPPPAEIEVALEPLPAPQPNPASEPKPTPKPKPEAKPEPKARRSPTPARHERSALGNPTPEAPKTIVKRDRPDVERRPKAPNTDPGGYEKLKNEAPASAGLPSGHRDRTPVIAQKPRTDPNPGGGGSPAPSLVPGGHGGARGPETPPEDIVFTGGGAGGIKLPKEAPRIGGGGGRSILSVPNPLAKDAIPEEKPGAGPGLGGGLGAGRDAGIGYGNGKGIGADLRGKRDIASLLSKPGSGIGAGQGHNMGTRPPGGGHGTGAELPGTGGSGIGYGRGSGIGVGNGSGTGVGDGSGSRVASRRGVPFGDITGLLRGGSDQGGGGIGGGPGGPGRGAVFGARPKGGGKGPISVVYVLDISGSMREGNKIGKAKEALKHALLELKSVDMFNLVFFFARAYIYYPSSMLEANPDLINEATNYIDNRVRTGDGTNIDAAMSLALSMPDITDVYLMSDGEPNRGEQDFDRLRAKIKEMNTHHVRIMTLGLCLGERYKGEPLMRGIAEDNDGSYHYINMNRIR
jgi:hypothetical protein